MIPDACLAVEGQIPAILATIQAKQTTYASAARRPAQLRWTHSAPPDRDAVAVDAVDDKANDMPQSWRDFGGYPATSRMRLRVDVYHTPRGDWGWVLVIDMIVDGATWRRVVNQGPEDWREQDWAEVRAARGGLGGGGIQLQAEAIAVATPVVAPVDYYVIFPSAKVATTVSQQYPHPSESWVAVGYTLADTIPVPAPIQVFTVAQAKAWLKLGRAVQVARDLFEALGFSSS